jgi:Fe-S cluster biosynthesis and repair protein YggX
MADSCGHTSAQSAPVGNKSGRMVFCQKFQKELPGLDSPPWPGELGQRIHDNISAQAWKLWEDRMKMILNEYRLMPWQKEAQDLVASTWRIFSSGRRRPSARLRASAVQIGPTPTVYIPQ